MKANDRQLMEAALKAAKAQAVTLRSLRSKSIDEYGGVPVWMVDLLGFCESIEVILQGLLSKEDVSEFHISDSKGEAFFVDEALDFIWSYYDGDELAIDLAIS